MIKLKRIKKFHYRHGGIEEILSTKYDYVELNNKIYTNKETYNKVINLEESFADWVINNNNDWYIIDYDDLSPYGINIKTYHYSRINFAFGDPLDKIYRAAFEIGDIPKYKIKYMHYGKISHDYLTYKDRGDLYIKNSLIEFPVFGYGWNNTFNITMPLSYFIKIPFKTHNYCAQSYLYEVLKHTLPRIYFEGNLNEIDINKISIDLIYKKASLKKHLLTI